MDVLQKYATKYMDIHTQVYGYTKIIPWVYGYTPKYKYTNILIFLLSMCPYFIHTKVYTSVMNLVSTLFKRS